MIQVIDDFLPEEMYESLRRHADRLSFVGARNPVDGILYPGISTDIPAEVRDFLFSFSGAKSYPLMFMRLSLAGVKAPHQAHTDALMGTTSMMLYLNRPEHSIGGTALVRHKQTGIVSNPKDKFEEALWKRDTNKPDAWEIYEQCDMKPNRAAVFPAHLMHRAEPLGGFGTTPHDGRLVLTMFY